MIRIVTREFDAGTLSEERYKGLIELNNKILPFNGFQSRKWNKTAFDYAFENVLVDDFMPCNYLFFFENLTPIGIIKGNFAGETIIIELIQASEVHKGYGRKMIEALPSIGINNITGYSTIEALGWWTKMEVDFSGRLMFDKYPLFTKKL